jgi:hypothetical protein
MDRITLSIVIGALVLLVIVVELVRQRRLEEQYSLLWLGAATALVVLAISRDLWDKLAIVVGIAYPPTALFIVLFVAMIMILLHFSTAISKLTRQNRQAAQEIGLLQWKLNELEKQLAQRADGDQPQP